MRRIIVILLIFAVASFAQSHLNANNIAYIFSNSVDVMGCGTIGQNPANLGFYDSDSTIQLGINVGFLPFVSIPAINLGNNSYSQSILNDNFFTGKTLTDKNKSELIDAISDDGMDSHYQISQNIFQFYKKRFAVGISLESIGNMVLPKSFIEFGLNSNEFGEKVSINDIDGQVLTYGNLSFNYGRELRQDFINEYFQNFYWGIGLDLILGGVYGEVEKVDGFVTARTDGVEVAGDAIGKIITGGFGFALDLAVTGKVNDQITTSLSLQNPISLVSWGLFDMIDIDGSNSKVYEYEYYLNLESEDFFGDEIDSLLDEAVKTDTSYAGDKFNTSLPASYNLGASYTFSENLKANIALYGYFSNKYGLDFIPKISTAVTYNPLPAWPLIIGLGTSRSNQFAWSFGTGINTKTYQLNLGISQYGGMFNSSKGIFFAMDQSFYF